LRTGAPEILTILLALAASTAGAAGACTSLTLATGHWRACFETPTPRYGHDVIGGPEWAALSLTGPDGTARRVELPADRVFEDMAPRLADLFATGRPEVVVVQSGVADGAQLAVYAPDRGGLAKIAATPAIGRPFRWLAPAGIGDLDGDGAPEIALVVMPHLAGRLEVWGVAAGGLTREAAASGFSNHRIGEPRIAGGLRDCGAGPEIVLADLAWRRVMAVRHGPGGLAARAVAQGAGPDMLEQALACAEGTR